MELEIESAKTEDKEKLQIKCYIRRMVLVGIFAACFMGIVYGLNYILAQPDGWSRFMLYHFYHRKEAIDNVWLGSSHVYCDVNPTLMDNLSGKNNFNLSTSSQNFSESYLLLQEADRVYDVKKVYLEMYYNMHIKGNESWYSVDRHFSVWDYVKNSFLKQQTIIEQEPDEELLAVYMPYVRYRNYIFDKWHIKRQVEYKKNSSYLNVSCEKVEVNGGAGVYWNNGFAEYDAVLEEGGMKWNKEYIEESPLSEEANEYLIRIIEYCREEEIELVLFSSPVYELQICSTGDYDNYVNQIKEIADAYDLKYYDFNLCREEYLPIQKLEYFKDVGHLNSKGAELFTPVLYDVVTNDRQEYFYNSYEEKLRDTEPAIYGVISEGEDENGDTMYTVASNREKELEYRIEFIPDKRAAECELIQEYNSNKEFKYQNEEEGSFLISARLLGETEPFIELQIKK